MAGRPSKYKKEYAGQVYKLCLLGATDEELANFFEVDVATINRWKHQYDDFCESIKRGKIVADAEVAESLYKRAKGYSFEEKTFEGNILTKKVVKDIAPDTGAAMAWLKNRRRENWRDKQDIEHSGTTNSNVNIDLSNVSTEDLKKLLK